MNFSHSLVDHCYLSVRCTVVAPGPRVVAYTVARDTEVDPWTLGTGTLRVPDGENSTTV